MGLALTMEGLQPSEPVASEEVARLLEKAKAGDLAAFEQLILCHERQVFLTALRLLGRPEDAQDAAQEVFLRLYKHLAGFDEIRDFRPWLYRVTVNVCRDVYRKRRRSSMLPLEEAATLPDLSSPDPHRALAQAEQRQIVGLGLASLSEKERAAMVLRDIEGLSTKEVARILGSREGTVRVQVASARLKIRKFAERFWKRKS